MLAVLDQTLHTVPMLATLGVRAEEVATGRIALRMPVSPSVVNHGGYLHSAALFAVGELAAVTVIAMHPQLANIEHLQKSSRIKYYVPSANDVIARAELLPEHVNGLLEALSHSPTSVEITVAIHDDASQSIAELVSHIALRPR